MESQIESHISHSSRILGDEEGAASIDKEEVVPGVIEVRDGPDIKVDLEAEEVDSSVEEDFREENLTKALPPKGPECLAKQKIKIRIDVIIAIREDTLQWNAPIIIKVKPRNPPKERSLKITLMPTVAQKNPNWPQPQPYLKHTRMHWLS